MYFCVFQVVSDFILESERESFIEQVREVIEMADEKGEGIKDGFPQVFILLCMNTMLFLSPAHWREYNYLIFFTFAVEWSATAWIDCAHAARLVNLN